MRFIKIGDAFFNPESVGAVYVKEHRIAENQIYAGWNVCVVVAGHEVVVERFNADVRTQTDLEAQVELGKKALSRVGQIADQLGVIVAT